MKNTNIFIKILRFLLIWLGRLAATAVIFAVIAVLGIAMILNMIFNGPSPSARDQLTATLMEYELTAEIPGLFLDQSVVEQICQTSNALPSDISDASLIKPDSDSRGLWEYYPEGIYSEELEEDTYTGQITLMRDSSHLDLRSGTGDHYFGFTEDGILMVTSSADSADILHISSRCDNILIMDGQINTGLYNSNSGYTARSAIGQCSDGTMILVTIHGGTETSLGGTMQDLIDILWEYGAVNACSLSNSTWGSEE